MTAQPVHHLSDPGTSITDLGTVAPVRALMLEVPESLLAERRRLGHDRFDEMWEGVLHMVPPPMFSHQGLGSKLFVLLASWASPVGLEAFYEIGVFDPEVPDYTSYRQADLLVAHPEVFSARGIEGPAHLAIEIRSPNDESFEKLPFYERVGVREFLIIDQTDLTIHHWTNGPDGFEPSLAGGGQPVPIACLATSIQAVGEQLRFEHGGVVTEIPFAG